MKRLNNLIDKIKMHLPVSRQQLLYVQIDVLEMVKATQESEVLIRNDIRLMFNQMTEAKKKPTKKKNVSQDKMYG